MPFSSIVHRIAGLASKVSPTPIEESLAGVLVRPTPFDVVVHDIGARWHCWEIPGELPSQHRHRLQLHLQTLQIAIEEDLATVLGERL